MSLLVIHYIEYSEMGAKSPNMARSAHPHPCLGQAPTDNCVTLYDQTHFLTYARIRDAERDRVDWREGAHVILGQDIDQDEIGAYRCWTSHLARAHWVATIGYALLLEDAGL